MSTSPPVQKSKCPQVKEIIREQFIGGRAPAMGREIRLPLARIVRSFGTPCKTAANAWDVFLPCAGYRNGTSVNNVGTNGNYWSSSPSGSNAWNMNFNSGNVNTNSNNRNNGFTVRPVLVL